MANTFTQVPADSTGDKIAAQDLVRGADTVLRQEMVVSDPVADVMAKVLTAAPAAADAGIVVREAQRGQGAMAASFPVVVASDQSVVPMQGQKSNNAAAPGATNVGALPAVANAAAPTQTEGNLVALRTNLAGDVAVTLDGEAVGLAAGTNNVGDVDVLTLPALPAGTNNIGDVDVLTLPALPAGTNNIGDVDVLSMPTGASAAQVQGTVAHDGIDAQNPVGVGYRAIAHGANPTAVAAADRTVGYANRAGVPFVIGGHPNVVTVEAAYTAAQTDTAIVTVAAGLKIVVTQIQMTADNANTVDVGFRVGFGATTTPTTTGVVLTHPGVAAGSGISRGDGSGILGVGADGEDLRITSEVPTTGSIRILVSYFTIES